MLGAFLGAVIIGVLSNGLTIMNIGEYYQQVVKGLVLILAVAFDVLDKQRKSEKNESSIGGMTDEVNFMLWRFQYLRT